MKPGKKPLYFTLQSKLLMYNLSIFKQENIKQHLKNPIIFELPCYSPIKNKKEN